MKDATRDLFTIRANNIAFISFFFIYLLDPLFYVGASDFNFPDIPVAVFGMILSLITLIFFSRKQRLKLINFVLMSAFIGMFFPILLYNEASFIDLWLVIRMISYTSLGYYLAKNILDNNYKLNFRLSFITLSVIFISLFIGVFFLNHLSAGDLHSVYLRPAHALAITSLICFYYLKHRNQKLSYIFILYIIAMLIFINSRATIIGVLFSLMMTEFFSARSIKKVIYLIIFPLILYILKIYAGLLYDEGYSGVGHRLIRLIGSRNEDTSLEGRHYYWLYGKKYFYEGLTGLGNYQYYNSLGPGTYIHDARSYIAEFGIFGLFMVTTKAYIFLKYISIYISYLKYSFKLNIIFSLIIYAILNMLFSQHLTYSNTFFIMGMALFAINHDYRKHSHIKALL